jgi:arginase
MAKLTCIGVPYWLGEKTEYTGAVETARDRGIAEDIGAAWTEIQPDFSGDTDPVIAVNRALAEAVAACDDDTIPLILAGDCTSCLGAMKGLEAHQPHVLWYDAHGDFNTPETTPSGFPGGMPLAALVGLGNAHLLQGLDLKPVADERITLTDARDLDPQEAILVQESNLTHLEDVSAVTDIDWSERPLYIHFDTDVVHLNDLPAVSYPAEGGSELQACIDSVTGAVRAGDVRGVLFTLWNDDHPGAAQSADSTLAVIRAVADILRSQ